MRDLIERMEADVRVQLAPKPRRLAHSLSVADESVRLARVYGVDEDCARMAGLVHDWYKVLDGPATIALARERGIDMGVALELVEPLLHGILAARDLPARYPDAPACVWQAVERHTTAHAHMSPLDMVVFVADGIEPGRKSYPALESLRAMVGSAPLDDLFWASFTSGVQYVIATERYLYPGTIDIYNALALERANS